MSTEECGVLLWVNAALLSTRMHMRDRRNWDDNAVARFFAWKKRCTATAGGGAVSSLWQYYCEHKTTSENVDILLCASIVSGCSMLCENVWR